MSTIIVAQPTTTAPIAHNEQPREVQPVEVQIWQYGEYCQGQLLYLRRQPIDDCENNHQRRGWWAALAQDSACETAGYLKRTNQVVDLDSLPF